MDLEPRVRLHCENHFHGIMILAITETKCAMIRSSKVFRLVPTETFITPKTSLSDNRVLEQETTGVLDMRLVRLCKRSYSI